MCADYFLKITANVLLISLVVTSEVTEVYPQSSCDIECFQQQSDPCAYTNECECILPNKNLTDINKDVLHTPSLQLLCRDEDFLIFKWNTSGNIHFLELSNETTTMLTLPTTCNIYTLGKLEPDSTYRARLLTLSNSAEVIGISDYVEAKTLRRGVEPLPVSSLVIKEFIPRDTAVDVALEWTPSEDLSCFYDFVWLGDHDMGDQTLRHPKQLFNMILENLEFDANYTVAIMAKHAYLEEESEQTWIEFHVPSCLGSLGTTDKCAPDQPTNITVTEDVVDINYEADNPLYNVKIKWDKPKFDPDYYVVILQDISLATENNRTHEEIKIQGNATECVFESVEVGIMYQVIIIAYSKGGHSEPAPIIRRMSGTRAAVVTLDKSNSTLPVVLITTSVSILVLTFVLALVFYRRYSAKKAKALQRQREEYFDETGRVTQTTTDMSHYDFEIAEFDDEWEIDQNSLHLETVLGEGAFGVVRHAWLDVGKGEESEVAIKMLKESPTMDELRQFYQEIQIMKSVGRHPHIVSLIGCLTKGRLKAPLLVVEYCAKGDLQTYLRSIWNAIINRASDTNVIDSDGSTQNNFANKLYDLNPCESLVQAKDLISFAHQVTMGMEYLSNLKVLHRDLAARNVLVCEDKTIKVSDFGLSRDVYCDNVYCKTGSGKLPLKWMALESLTHQRYTIQSDVWSFGILLWEIVTLGGNPYAGIPPNDLLQLLQSGYRMEKPKNCSEELYQIMLHCWRPSPKDRPTFSSLRTTFDGLLSHMVDYLNLDLGYTNDQNHTNRVCNDVSSERYVSPLP